MGFPSPAQDHVEHRLNLNDIQMPNLANMVRIETPEGLGVEGQPCKKPR